MQGEQIPTGRTIIDLNGIHTNDSNSGHCGYCGHKKQKYGAYQWGLRSKKMTVQDYQILMDRRWRRCGTYYYKYDLQKSCCRPFTIKLLCNEFQISQSQKKVMKKFNKFLKGEIDMQGNKVQQNMEIQKQNSKSQLNNQQNTQEKDIHLTQVDSIIIEILKYLPNYLANFNEQNRGAILKSSITTKSKDKKLQKTKSWASNALLRMFYKQQEISKDKTQTLKDFVDGLKNIPELEFNKDQSAIRLEESGYLTFIDMTQDEEIKQESEQKQKSQKTDKKKNIKEQEEEKKEPTLKIDDQDLMYRQYFKEFVPLDLKPGEKMHHRYTVQITRAINRKETFEVFKLYQDKVHGEKEKSSESYARFLCRNPLFDPLDKEDSQRIIKRDKQLDDERQLKDEGVWPEFLGGYHMLHMIDGQVFAVGVLDYCPNVLSSVYFFYDPKFEFLSPGVLGAIREIEYQLRIMEVFNPEFNNYYMGLYFQDCQKSVYKANYKPSQVVCPVTYNYVYLTEEVKEKIEKDEIPKLSEKPKVREMDIPENTINALVKNFKFYSEGRKLGIDQLQKNYQKMISDNLRDLYFNIGLDIALNSIFEC